jgi:hypothetical protein
MPSCRNCIHYKPYSYDLSSDLGKCAYFGTKNIETGIIQMEYASLCRTDADKCGLYGKYFEEDMNAEYKNLLGNIIKPLPFEVSIIIIYMSFFSIYIQLLKHHSN